jgi:hypothetical protein
MIRCRPARLGLPHSWRISWRSNWTQNVVAVELAGEAGSNRRRLHCVPTTVRRRIVREIAASSHISTRESYLR